MEARPYLSVVIPAYNEQERLKRFVPGIVKFLEAKGQPFEIVVVNDGSRDGAVKAGMLDARGEFVLFTDADQSTPITEVEKVLPKLERDGYDMVIGSRAMPGAGVEQPQAWYRALAGKLFGVGTKLFCIRGFYDTQCGFKVMKRDVAQKVFPQVTSNSAIFDIEMLVVATREGYRIAEVAVQWVHDPDTRIPYNLRRAMNIWLELFRINRVQKVVRALKARTS